MPERHSVLLYSNSNVANQYTVKYLGDEHPLTNKFRTLLTQLYAENNQSQKAHSMVVMAYGFLHIKLGKEHRDTIQAKAVVDSFSKNSENLML
ncbi:MAG: hypothetical protein ABJK37_23115 [Paraglaciecola sp.]|uniref:hypothetical protein n=1 Tax=Paraglaciecola sp. TaxID=1920173 RepID=UPI0032971DAB